MYGSAMPRSLYTPDQQRAAFLAKCSTADPTACWLWTGATRGPYPAFGVHGRLVGAHRWSLEHLGGTPPPAPDLECEHRCDTPLCVNPLHLEWVTRLENERRKTARDRRPSGPRGMVCEDHGPYQGTARRGDGRVFAFCVPCRREYQRQYQQRRRAQKQRGAADGV